ncbi:MAG TPA: hypothetical protein VK274_06060 [Pyrinomonadaceae bacterium]|nr:hypothetical protein [Pyrinomonadaceae bacterium]
MKQRKLFGILILSLLIVVSVATDAMGQGRGRRASRRFDNKCSKFVNCHDARDGRWDGRGPDRRSRVSNVFRRRRNRDRDFDNIRSRRRHRDRDLNDDRWRRRR